MSKHWKFNFYWYGITDGGLGIQWERHKAYWSFSTILVLGEIEFVWKRKHKTGKVRQ
jgi:hypothetical protein